MGPNTSIQASRHNNRVLDLLGHRLKAFPCTSVYFNSFLPRCVRDPRSERHLCDPHVSPTVMSTTGRPLVPFLGRCGGDPRLRQRQRLVTKFPGGGDPRCDRATTEAAAAAKAVCLVPVGAGLRASLLRRHHVAHGR
ncbi:hypothetical protein NDU88_007793 [Pleurodeles waltl]|uniref:Uncharacterized protein n=1 Tax=Pleurodeles waltl TaxID=8319 RepID=A0AAV7RU10_PLEWA|nr:hypothetical protein NDU88_007793 [Pleurodeles waltl]